MDFEDGTSDFDATDFSRSFYDEDDQPSYDCKRLNQLFQEISLSLTSLTEAARKVTSEIERDLRKLDINKEDLIGFKLGTMEVLKNLNTSADIEDFVKTALNGCIDGMMCSQIVAKTFPNTQMIPRRFQEALLIMIQVLKVLRLSPHVREERARFHMEIESKLVPYTKEYLKGKQDYQRLSHYQQTIKGFQIMKEIVHGIDVLYHVLEERRHSLSCNVVPRPTTEFALHAEEITTTMITSQDVSSNQDLICWLSSV